MGNKIRDDADAQFMTAETPGLPVLGMLPHTLAVQDADRQGRALYDHVPALRTATESIAARLTTEIEGKHA
mgnify:CR=1 FL=1